MALPIKFSFILDGLGFAIWRRAGEAWKFASSPEKGLQCGHAKNSSVNLDSILCLLLLSAPANCCFLLQLFGIQTWHYEVCLGMLCACVCACVSVDSV